MAKSTRKRKTKTPAPKVLPDFGAGEWTGVTPEILAKWWKACPSVKIKRELAAALMWCEDSGKTYVNYRLFLGNWLRRVQANAPPEAKPEISEELAAARRDDQEALEKRRVRRARRG